MATDANENMIIVSQIQKNDRVRKKVCAWANAFRQQQLNLHPEKSIEDMKKYQLIKKHDRVVSVPDDANENMIIVSQIQKNDRVRRCEHCFSVAHLFRLVEHCCYLHAEKNIEIMDKYRLIETRIKRWKREHGELSRMEKTGSGRRCGCLTVRESFSA